MNCIIQNIRLVKSVDLRVLFRPIHLVRIVPKPPIPPTHSKPDLTNPWSSLNMIQFWQCFLLKYANQFNRRLNAMFRNVNRLFFGLKIHKKRDLCHVHGLFQKIETQKSKKINNIKPSITGITFSC